MDDTILVAILSLLGTLVGSLSGILTANNLIKYRIQKLEEKVDKHNQVIDRVYKLEQEEAVFEKEFENVYDKIEDLEGYHK